MRNGLQDTIYNHCIGSRAQQRTPEFVLVKFGCNARMFEHFHLVCSWPWLTALQSGVSCFCLGVCRCSSSIAFSACRTLVCATSIYSPAFTAFLYFTFLY